MLSHKICCVQTARELAQDVFLDVYLQKEGLIKILHFKAYIFGIAKHKVFNHYRRQLVQEKYQQRSIINVLDTDTTKAYEILENKELLQIISEKIERLPPKCREIFRLSRESQLSYKVIAQKMSISENTVDQHIRKALRIIRNTLNDYHGSTTIILIFILCRNV